MFICVGLYIHCPKCTFFDLSYLIQSNFAMHNGTKLFARRLVRVWGIGRVPEFITDSPLLRDVVV